MTPAEMSNRLWMNSSRLQLYNITHLCTLPSLFSPVVLRVASESGQPGDDGAALSHLTA